MTGLFQDQGEQEPAGVATTPELEALIARHAPTIFCISGGKDSRYATEEGMKELDRRGHRGERKLMYANVGRRMVWTDAQEQCQRLADRMKVELIVVEREAGDLLDRWWTRQENNVERYAALSCVQLILPWSTPSMRFCTSELKTAILSRRAKKMYRGQPLIQVVGIRRDESKSKCSGRGIAPVAKVIEAKKGKTPPLPEGSIIWHPIVHVKTQAVFQILRASQVPLPDAYEVYGMSRYSCLYCIMASEDDLFNACKDERNHETYREQCELEIVSTFSFQSTRWLSDVRPDLLTQSQRDRLAGAKEAARLREEAESLIPAHLLFENNGGRDSWPKVLPTPSEADLLADVRRRVAEACGLQIGFTTGDEVFARYEELLRLRALKEGKAAEVEESATAPVMPAAGAAQLQMEF